MSLKCEQDERPSKVKSGLASHDPNTNMISYQMLLTAFQDLFHVSGSRDEVNAVNRVGRKGTKLDDHVLMTRCLDDDMIHACPIYKMTESCIHAQKLFYSSVYFGLASSVVKGIKAGIKPVINLKGFLVGNGVCDPQFDGNALVPFAHGMGLISDIMFKEAEVLCNGNYHMSNNTDCQKIMYKIDTVLDGLNIYAILELCFHIGELKTVVNENTTFIPESFKELGSTERPLAVRKRMFGRVWTFRAPVEDGVISLWPELMRKITFPCITLTPNMQSLVGDSRTDKGSERLLHPALSDQKQRDFSIKLWKNTFHNALKRHCPVRAGGHECVPITDTNPEGLIAAYGKWASAIAGRLRAGGHSCKVLEKDAFQKQMLEKLIWICAFMLVGARHPGATVGVVEKEHRYEVSSLIAELAGAAAAEKGLDFEGGIEDRLCSYSRAVAHFPTTVKGFKWRNGWFYSLSER
ncbi:hypothetical protein ACS0TY_024722 [Phlomoides rotata]